jgi:hypothetical protein
LSTWQVVFSGTEVPGLTGRADLISSALIRPAWAADQMLLCSVFKERMRWKLSVAPGPRFSEKTLRLSTRFGQAQADFRIRTICEKRRPSDRRCCR